MAPCASQANEKEVESFADKWAIVVGDGDFQNPEWSIKYASKDGADFRDYLIRKANFAPEHIKVLIDKSATKQNVMSAFDWLGKVATPDDLVVVYVRTRGALADHDKRTLDYVAANGSAPEWAGAFHHSQSGCLVNCKLDRNKIFLAFYDTYPDTIQTSGIDMAIFVDVLLERIHPGGFVIIADSDFSGTIWRGAQFLPIDQRVPGGHPFHLVTSTGDYEISRESDEFHNSIFTRDLIEALAKSSDTTPFLTTANSIRQKVHQDVAEIKAKSSKDSGKQDATDNKSNHWEGILTLGYDFGYGVNLSTPASAPRGESERVDVSKEKNLTAEETAVLERLVPETTPSREKQLVSLKSRLCAYKYELSRYKEACDKLGQNTAQTNEGLMQLRRLGSCVWAERTEILFLVGQSALLAVDKQLGMTPDMLKNLERARPLKQAQP